jgi:hypothetical protein
MVRDTRTGAVPVPHHHNFDIRKVVVRHRAHSITIRVNFEKIDVSGKPRKYQYGVSGYAIVNPKAMPKPDGYGNVPWEWELYFQKAHPHRPLYLLVLDAYYEEVYGCFGEPWRPHQPAGPAKRLAGRINYREGFMVASFPRRCFTHDGSPPRWIQVSVSNGAYSGGAFDHWIKPTKTTSVDFLHLRRDAYLSPRLYPPEVAGS